VRAKHLIPNAVTLANIALGFMGILAAAHGQFEPGVGRESDGRLHVRDAPGPVVLEGTRFHGAAAPASARTARCSANQSRAAPAACSSSERSLYSVMWVESPTTTSFFCAVGSWL